LAAGNSWPRTNKTWIPATPFSNGYADAAAVRLGLWVDSIIMGSSLCLSPNGEGAY
jgi:hypothetical protein